jgi:hypothetical protein
MIEVLRAIAALAALALARTGVATAVASMIGQ